MGSATYGWVAETLGGPNASPGRMQGRHAAEHHPGLGVGQVGPGGGAMTIIKEVNKKPVKSVAELREQLNKLILKFLKFLKQCNILTYNLKIEFKQDYRM